ncbi:MAG: hypothetical protein PHV34_09155 [Verrucomicrobiae bacterium]|nr:hypothetical protein [Verrucomicrobiae bacterium]
MTSSNDSFLTRAWRGWVRFGHWLGNVLSWVWMPLFYFTIALPAALFIRLAKDPMGVKGPDRKSYWTPKELPPMDLDWAKNQGTVHQEGQ